MNLLLLTETPAITLYQDVENNWLYVDWQGDLTLPIVQENCLVIAQFFLRGHYTKVLNDNTNVVSLTPDIAPWLAKQYLPYISMGGVKFIAWVYSTSLSSQYYTELAIYDLEAPVVALFADVAAAYSWLKTAKFKPPVSLAGPAPDIDKRMDELKTREEATTIIVALEDRVNYLNSSAPPK